MRAPSSTQRREHLRGVANAFPAAGSSRLWVPARHRGLKSTKSLPTQGAGEPITTKPQKTDQERWAGDSGGERDELFEEACDLSRHERASRPSCNAACASAWPRRDVSIRWSAKV